MINILVVDNHDSFVYNIIEILRLNPNCMFDVVLSDQIVLNTAKKYDKILLSPGAGLPSERPLMMNLLQELYQTHSFLGICLGHQAIAEFFGGQLQQLSYPKHGHLSRLEIVNFSDKLLTHIPQNIAIGRYHSWIVSPKNFPKELKVSSFDDEKNIMSLFHCSLPIHGIQFHPESIITELGKEMIDNWIQE